LLGGDRQRRAAEQALPRLRWRLQDHRHVERTAARAVEAAGRIGASMDQVRAQIGRVAASLQLVRAATGPAEKALERTVQRLGAAAVNTATSLLPKGLQLPIRIAVQALDRVRDLGLGR
jgi:ABC-type transporter Mla subunit MlaD